MPLSFSSRVLKKCFAPGADRERNGIQESPERNRTAAEKSFSQPASAKSVDMTMPVELVGVDVIEPRAAPCVGGA